MLSCGQSLPYRMKELLFSLPSTLSSLPYIIFHAVGWKIKIKPLDT